MNKNNDGFTLGFGALAAICIIGVYSVVVLKTAEYIFN